MNDPESFMTRWSRRKRAAAEDAEVSRPANAPDAAAASEGALESDCKPAAPSEHAGASAAPPFDPATLPPIDSITAESDIRGFFAPGVPAELTRAALRRVWTADPKIRDFVGLADYDWDFNTPGAITGFGPLQMTDELRRQVTQMVGRSLVPEDAERPVPTEGKEHPAPPSVETARESDAATGEEPKPVAETDVGTAQDQPDRQDSLAYNSKQPLQCDKESVAAQHNLAKPDDNQLIVKRSHGRALPE
jgi:uncharacterized protein DUF3306